MKELLKACELALIYLDDGAPISAARVLRDAVAAAEASEKPTPKKKKGKDSPD